MGEDNDTDTDDEEDALEAHGFVRTTEDGPPEWFKASVEKLYRRHMDADHLEVSFEDRFVKVVFDEEATSTVRTVIANPRDEDGHVVVELNKYSQADNEAVFDLKPVDIDVTDDT